MTGVTSNQEAGTSAQLDLKEHSSYKIFCPHSDASSNLKGDYGTEQPGFTETRVNNDNCCHEWISFTEHLFCAR